MALKTLMLIPIISLVFFLLLAVHVESAVSTELDAEDEGEYYFLDSVLENDGSARRSRFLTTSINKKAATIKKGATCGVSKGNKKPQVCNGVSANNGASLLYCCKAHCRNVLTDGNNCGKCGRKCQFGQRCCGGVCTNVLRSRSNCGKCGKKCRKGVKCDFGFCGYA